MNALEVARKMETDAIRLYTEAAGKTKYEAGKKTRGTASGSGG